MKISIITINLNDATGLSKTIASVRAQAYPAIEYVIIDGGSTDGSINVIEDSSDGIDYWISEQDSGMYPAMNKGIARANGEYLLFLNSGDSLTDSDTIKNAVSQFQDEDIIFGNLNIVYHGRICRTELYPDALSLNYFIEGALPHQAMFIKKSVFTKTGFYDENLKICSDWKFQLDAICRDKCTYKHINFTIADFSGHGISSRQENQSLIKQEKESVLINNYYLLKADLELIKQQKDLSHYYKNSKRVNLLKRFGVLKQFPVLDNDCAQN